MPRNEADDCTLACLADRIQVMLNMAYPFFEGYTSHDDGSHTVEACAMDAYNLIANVQGLFSEYSGIAQGIADELFALRCGAREMRAAV